MRADRYAAAHVYHDQSQRLIRLSDLLRISLRNRLLVQSVEDTAAGNLRHTGISCDGHQLVHNDRINNVSGNADGISELSCKDTAEVGRMLSLYTLLQIGKKLVRNRIGSSGNGL